MNNQAVATSSRNGTNLLRDYENIKVPVDPNERQRYLTPEANDPE